MSTPIFPGLEDILTIIMSDLPEGVYAEDRADNADLSQRSYSSSELRAHAQVYATLYSNLEDIYLNKFISTIQPDGLADWEKELFATTQDATLPFTTRQQNLLAKIRANGGISLPAIRAVVAAILTPQGLAFDILPYNGQYNGTAYGAWILEESQLGYDTYLAAQDPLIGAMQNPGQVPLDCSLNYAAAGITQQQLIDIQMTAYTYEVDIYGNADANTLALLDSQLTALEPARSTHVIRNNVTPPQP